MKKVAILQSNYIPWKGYFDIIAKVDEFILYDDMQYTRRDWRNRNKIMTPNGLMWLTIPVEKKGKYYQKIKETKVMGHEWIDNHLRSLQANYARAEFYDEYIERIRMVYEACRDEIYLSKINYRFIKEICSILGIKTQITWSMDYSLLDGKTERLVGLVKAAGGNQYLSGPAAKDYIISELFEEAGIELRWMDYSGYPEYKQLGKEFEHGVSVLDLIFNMGKDAKRYMKKSERDMSDKMDSIWNLRRDSVRGGAKYQNRLIYKEGSCFKVRCHVIFYDLHLNGLGFFALLEDEKIKDGSTGEVAA